MWVASFLSKGKKMYMFCQSDVWKKEAEVGIILLTKEVLLK